MEKEAGIGAVYKFTGKNFNLWKNQLRIALDGRDIFTIVDKTETFQNAVDKEAWKKKDNLAKWIITTSVDQEHLAMIINCKTSAEMWERLVCIHEQVSAESSFMMIQQFVDYKFNKGDSIAVHIAKIETMAQNLEDIGQKMSEEQIISKMITSLPSDYRHVLTAWKSMPPNQKTRKTLIMRVFEEETMNKLIKDREIEETDSALLVRSRRDDHRSSEGESKFNNERIKELKRKSRCHRCGEMGHWWQDNICSKKEVKKFGQRGTEASQSSARVAESKDTTELKDSTALVTQSMIQNPLSEALLARNSNEEIWYADAGATEHMSDNRDAFINFKEVPKGTWPVAIANEQNLWVQGKGDIKIKRRVHDKWLDGTLHDVLYIPDLRTNLFSIGRAADRGVVTIYRKNTCQMIGDNGEGDILLTGVRTGSSLYKLHLTALVADNKESCAYRVTTRASGSNPSTTTVAENDKQGEQVLNKRPLIDNIELWHHRFCHINSHSLRQTEKAVQGMVIQDKKSDKFFCEGCVFGKQQRNNYPALTEKERDTEPGTFFHIDLCGPMSTASVGGALYFMLCKDNHTGYMVIFFLKEKSEALNYLKQLCSMVKQELHIDIQRIKTDLGGEFKNKQFGAFTKDKGIIHEFSAAYTSEQNGFIERNNRTIVEAARSMLHSRGLPLTLWAEAANTAVFVWNRTVNRQHTDVTPFEMLFQQVPDVSYFRAFGSDAYLHIPKKLRTKWEAKSQKLILVGYDQKGRAYRLWNPSTKRIHVGVDVVIHETLGIQTGEIRSSQHIQCTDSMVDLSFPTEITPSAPTTSTTIAAPPTSSDLRSSEDSHPMHPTQDIPNDEIFFEDNSAPIPIPYFDTNTETLTTTPFQGEYMTAPFQGELGSTSLQGENNAVQSPEQRDFTDLPENLEQLHVSPTLSQSVSPSLIHSHTNRNEEAAAISDEGDLGFRLPPRSRNPPIRYGEWIKYDDNRSTTGSAAYIVTKSERIPEPKTYKEAMTSPHAQQWKQAMTKEFTSLVDNKTWVLKPLPEGRKAVKCKWIFKVKYKPSGEVERFKARLVAKGFSQVAGIDFTETYAPVIKYDAVRAVFVISNEHGMFKAQFDVCTAYLNADLIDIIFMEQPEGFEDPQWPIFVCFLLKSLYGLKQSARRWNKTFDKFAQQFNLLPSIADPCVYYSNDTTHPDKVETILGIFVDDGLLCSTNAQKLEDILHYLDNVFKITRGDMGYYIGLEVYQSPSIGVTFLHQHRYIQHTLQRFGMANSYSVSTPADPNVNLSSIPDPSESTEVLQVPYKEAIGCLMFISHLTRPDITYAVNHAAKFCEKPRHIHWTAVKRILRYLRGTPDVGLIYQRQTSVPQLTGFCDADYAGDLDTRRSRSGYVFKFGSGIIAWSSQGQKCTAQSTTEAEYIAACMATKEAIWLRRLLHSIGYPQHVPTPLFGDNQSAIRLVKNPEYHKRTKHIDIQYHFIREKFEHGEIDISYISTDLQLADILTKALPRDKFERFRSQLPMTSLKDVQAMSDTHSAKFSET